MTNTSVMVVLVGPSGVGKTTLARRLLSDGVVKASVVSTSTRPLGLNEKPGEYYIVSEEEFNNTTLIEHAEYAGNYYGISLEEFNRCMTLGDTVVAAEIHGAKQIMNYCRINNSGIPVLIFIDANDSFIRGRLESRGRGDVTKRMSRLELDRLSAPECDYTVLNNDNHIQECLDAIIRIIQKSKTTYINKGC